MNITSENVYDFNKLNETRNILQNTIEEYEEKCCFYLYRNVKVRCVGEFYDKIKNETKIININRYNNIGELNKIMQKSRGEIKLIIIIEAKNIIEGRINKNIIDIYFKSGFMPILWRKFYGRGAKRRRCVYNKHVNRNEKHYCHFNER